MFVKTVACWLYAQFEMAKAWFVVGRSIWKLVVASDPQKQSILAFKNENHKTIRYHQFYPQMDLRVIFTQ